MNIVRWNNLSSAMPAMNRLDDLFDSMIYKTLERNQNWTPEVSISENDKLYTVTMDIPGVDKKDVNIEVEGSCLTVSGKRDEKNEKDITEKLLKLDNITLILTTHKKEIISRFHKIFQIKDKKIIELRT